MPTPTVRRNISELDLGLDSACILAALLHSRAWKDRAEELWEEMLEIHESGLEPSFLLMENWAPGGKTNRLPWDSQAPRIQTFSPSPRSTLTNVHLSRSDHFYYFGGGSIQENVLPLKFSFPMHLCCVEPSFHLPQIKFAREFLKYIQWHPWTLGKQEGGVSGGEEGVTQEQLPPWLTYMLHSVKRVIKIFLNGQLSNFSLAT